MGLFDWFRKPKPPPSLPELAYDVAYFILPQWAFGALPKLVDMCLNSPTYAGPFFYRLAVRNRRATPNSPDGAQFRWHHGDLNADSQYFALEYPPPPPIPPDAFPKEFPPKGPITLPRVILAPHFSVITRAPAGVHYFILGQNPVPGATTFRCIEGNMNGNLGGGSEPNLPAFLDQVRNHLTKSSVPQRPRHQKTAILSVHLSTI